MDVGAATVLLDPMRAFRAPSDILVGGQGYQVFILDTDTSMRWCTASRAAPPVTMLATDTLGSQPLRLQPGLINGANKLTTTVIAAKERVRRVFLR